MATYKYPINITGDTQILIGGLRNLNKEDFLKEIIEAYATAEQHKDKEFLIDYNLYDRHSIDITVQQAACIFAIASPIPSNIVFEEEFEKLIPFRRDLTKA